MESDQKLEEDARCAGTCRGCFVPIKSTETLRWIGGSALRWSGLLRWADEALGREALQFVGSDCDSAGLPFSPMAFPGFPDFLGTIAKVCPLGSRLGEVCAFGPETRFLNSFSVPHRSVRTVLNRSIICRFI